MKPLFVADDIHNEIKVRSAVKSVPIYKFVDNLIRKSLRLPTKPAKKGGK